MALRLDMTPLFFMGKPTPTDQALLELASEDGNFALEESDLSSAAFHGRSWPELGTDQKPGSSIDAAAYLSSAKDYLDTRLRYWPVVRYFVARRLEGSDHWQRLGKVIDEAGELGISPGDLQEVLFKPGFNIFSPDRSFSARDRLRQLRVYVSVLKQNPWLFPRRSEVDR